MKHISALISVCSLMLFYRNDAALSFCDFTPPFFQLMWTVPNALLHAPPSYNLSIDQLCHSCGKRTRRSSKRAE